MDSQLNGPAAPAPPGQTSNLIDPPSQAYLWVITVVLSLSLTTPMVLMRLYVSTFLLKLLRWDDGLVFLGWLLLIAYSTIGLYFGRYGALKDIWNVPLKNVIEWAHLAYIEEIIYSFLIYIVKLAVLVLYRRIFVPARGKKRTWVWWTITSVIIFNTLFYTANTFVRAFRCHPISKAWMLNEPGMCINLWAEIIATAALNVFSDFCILAIPVMVIRRLQMPPKRKAEMYFIFAFGFLTFGSSIARLVYSVLAMKTENQTKALMKIALWTSAEITACFLTACVPMVPRLRRHLISKTQSSRRSSEKTLVDEKSPKSSEKTKSTKKPNSWSAISFTRSTISGDEEDPYYMNEVSSSSPEENSRSGTSKYEDNIMISKAVDITSVPRAHLPHSDESKSKAVLMGNASQVSRLSE